MLGFPTDANTKRQPAALDCTKIKSANTGISAVLLSKIPDIMQTSGIKGTNGPLPSSMNSKSIASDCGAHAKMLEIWEELGLHPPVDVCPQLCF